jgi:two-component system sensor histidine kinase PhoQ
VRAEIEIAPDLQFRGVEGDLMELLGNLLDNAFKWCNRRVRTSARGKGRRLEILVEDDGPGIAPDQVRRVLERGTRADEETPGHGIGLAVAREICTAYGGELSIGHSTLGGARFRIRLGADIGS